MRKVLFLLFAVCLFAEERVDLGVVNRIRAEALERSKIGDYMFNLADLYTPRVTNSENFRKGGDWAVKQLQEIGLTNVKKETWGPYGRGWEYSYFSAHMIEPQYQPLIGYPLAYTPGTKGVVTGEVVLAPMKTDADLEKFKGKLKGKIVLYSAPRVPGAPSETTLRMLAQFPPNSPEAQAMAAMYGRTGPYTDQDLALIASAPEPRIGGTSSGRMLSPEYIAQRQFRAKLTKFLIDEGVLAAVTNGTTGDNGTVFGTLGGSYDKKEPLPPPMIVITGEHYNRMARLAEKNVAVKMQLEVRTKIYEDNLETFNIVGDIPGGKKKDEVVILGAHFDTWHGGTGATDNDTGTAVMMEAVRILKALNVPMDRTIRIGLWAAEEQGLLGSRAYVTEHFANREDMKVKPEHAKVAAYFNHDNGSGKIRGIYLQGNDMCRPIFEAWLKPFRDLGASTVTIRNTSGTDHQSFDAVGLPGFQFIQDPLDYNTKTHHSNMDVLDNVKQGDLMQAAAIIASFAYHAATREEMLPRKPLPKPQPRREGAGF
jgi:hypothetical protein